MYFDKLLIEKLLHQILFPHYEMTNNNYITK